MKVLKKQDVTNWSYKHTCVHCDSELEAEASDLSFGHVDGDMREPGYDYFWATCTVCGMNFNVLTDKIPKLVQLAAKEKEKNKTSRGNSGNYFDR